MQEDKLVELCANGNNKALEILYKKYYPVLYIVAVRYIADKSLAQDIVQDCFIKIFTSFDKFKWRGEGSLRAWMSRITANACIEHLRKNKVDVFNIAEIKDIVVDDNTPDTIKDVPKEVLLSFIKELPDGYRTIFNLYVFENFSHKEIAKALNIKEKSSSSQLSRAKIVLANRINEYLKLKR